jgi:ABC-type bacteriocin/lantibiotic exporter with double-glycine peptidase domain
VRWSESATASLQLVSPLALLAVGAALVLQGRLSLGTIDQDIDAMTSRYATVLAAGFVVIWPLPPGA